jgi:hypothetical protein
MDYQAKDWADSPFQAVAAHRKLPQELVQVRDEVPAMFVAMSCLRGTFSAGHSAGGRNRPNRGPGL